MASDNLQRASELPTGSFGKAWSCEPGISKGDVRDPQLGRAAESENPGMAQALTEAIRVTSAADVARQQLFKPSPAATTHPSDRQTSGTDTFRPTASDSRISLVGWAFRGVA